MEKGIADKIIPVETSESNPPLHLSGAASGERGPVIGPLFVLGLRVNDRRFA